jgi:hypothetical protein
MSPAVPSVSVVVPVLNAQPWLADLLGSLMAQQPSPPREIILVDSGSTDGTQAEAARWSGVRVVPIASFTHGGARNLGARQAGGDLLFLLTQDARPADVHTLAHLVAALDQPDVVAAYARQIPRADAHPMEQFFLADRFPARPAVVRRAVAGRPLLVGDVFFSNVAALIRRSALLAHPFDETLIMSEDQQFSRDVLLAGHAVVYAPASVRACIPTTTRWAFACAAISTACTRCGNCFRATAFRAPRGASAVDVPVARVEVTWCARHPGYGCRIMRSYCSRQDCGYFAGFTLRRSVMPRWMARRIESAPVLLVMMEKPTNMLKSVESS